eukprot:scaffold22877_cov18-Prasinocladus_malaysianus.AAC.1
MILKIHRIINRFLFPAQNFVGSFATTRLSRRWSNDVRSVEGTTVLQVFAASFIRSRVAIQKAAPGKLSHARLDVIE